MANSNNYTTKTYVFIDTKVEDYPSLQSGVVPGIEAVLLDPNRDGIAQITEHLHQHPNSQVHIVSHGTPGYLELGNSQLSLDTLDQYAEPISTWQSTSIYIYGCNVAAGDAGAEFLDKLHQLTGANIAASQNRVGNGPDTFVFAAGEGHDTITDFAKTNDLIGLTGGLSFGQLSFSGNDIKFGTEILATLTGVNTITLTAANFVTV